MVKPTFYHIVFQTTDGFMDPLEDGIFTSMYFRISKTVMRVFVLAGSPFALDHDVMRC